MNDKKKEVRWFSIMDYEKEADYLRDGFHIRKGMQEKTADGSI
ncbi:MAG: hypothetical protein V8S56_08380 [Lachnospiraceae bacterium]